MKITMLMILSVLSTSLLAKDTIILMGGGGEPATANETQFDGSMEGVADFFNDNKNTYQATISFNGGHSKTESKIRKDFKDAEVYSYFTDKNYNKIIDDAIAKLNTNQIPAGGRLLVFIDSHGAEKSLEQTHSVATSASVMSNMNAIGANTVSLDKIKKLSDLAEKKGVRLGIVDGSCHSGNSLSLANTKTCVITGSGPIHYSYSSFPATFAKKMKKGKNLEQIFLEAREDVGGIGFPMISTAEGKAVQDAIYPYLTPYMYYHDDYRGMELDKIDAYLEGINTPVQMCRREEDYTQLKNLLKLIEDVSAIEAQSGKGDAVDLSKLKNKIAEYKKTQDEYLKKLLSLDLSIYNKTVEIKAAQLTATYTYKELLATDYIFQIKNQGDAILKSTLSDKKQDEIQKRIEFYKQCQLIKEQIVLANPELQKQMAILDGLKSDDKVNSDVAFGIMKEAQKAYSAAYQTKQSDLVKQGQRPPNPCKDFVL